MVRVSNQIKWQTLISENGTVPYLYTAKLDSEASVLLMTLQEFNLENRKCSEDKFEKFFGKNSDGKSP